MKARTLSKVAVLSFWLWWVAELVLDKHLSRATADSFGYFLFRSIVHLGLVVLWVESDAVARQYTVRRGLRYFVVFLVVIGVPVYVIRSRGFFGFLKFLGWFLLCMVAFFAVCSALAFAGAI